MSRYHSYLNTAKEIILSFKGETPLSIFIKSYFSQRRKHGGTDRRIISNLCFCYFRLGFAFPELETEERVLTGLFLSSHAPDPVLELLKPEWNQIINLEVEKKLSFLGHNAGDLDLFPWKQELSKDIDPTAFEYSFFIQPDLFLRIRPGKEKSVIHKLTASGIKFNILKNNEVAIPNASKLEQVIELDEEAIIQDLNSQRIGDFFSAIPSANLSTAWDCCAGSGGKSILLYDHHPDIRLTVSDIRESILANLKKRLEKAGIRQYKIVQSDLTKPNAKPALPLFPFILADLPCSGSGTWSRTPEQLIYFEKNKIESFVNLQKRIHAGVLPYLERAGYLLYITCSVFKEENEGVVKFLQDDFGLELISMEMLKGYEEKADTLFAAILRNPE